MKSDSRTWGLRFHSKIPMGKRRWITRTNWCGDSEANSWKDTIARTSLLTEKNVLKCWKCWSKHRSARSKWNVETAMYNMADCNGVDFFFKQKKSGQGLGKRKNCKMWRNFFVKIVTWQDRKFWTKIPTAPMTVYVLIMRQKITKSCWKGSINCVENCFLSKKK